MKALNKNYFFKLSIVLTLFLTVFANAQNVDINLLRDINLKRDQSLDPTFKFLSDSDAPISIGAPVVIYAIGMINKDADIKKKSIYIGETFIVSTFIAVAMKYAIKRNRPFVTYPELDKQSAGGGYSFPSGHTSVAFATATSLSFAFPKWYVIAPSFVWASSVGYSRMDLGVHYPTDVLAGAIVGSGSAYLTYKLNKWINKKKNKPILFDGNVVINKIF
jgi:membrane-associated phospholipid phosphatase